MSAGVFSQRADESSLETVCARYYELREIDIGGSGICTKRFFGQADKMVPNLELEPLRSLTELLGKELMFIAAWMSAQPVPGGLDDHTKILKLRFPAEFVLDFFRTGD